MFKRKRIKLWKDIEEFFEAEEKKLEAVQLSQECSKIRIAVREARKILKSRDFPIREEKVKL